MPDSKNSMTREQWIRSNALRHAVLLVISDPERYGLFAVARQFENFIATGNEDVEPDYEFPNFDNPETS